MVSATSASITPPPVVIDASVWAAFFLTMDVNYQASFTWIDKRTAAGGAIYEPAILLTEVAAAVSRRLGQAQRALRAASTIERFAYIHIVPMDSTLMQEATQIAATLSLRGADAIYVATAKLLNLPLLTWDGEQLTRPAGIIVTIQP
jgi:predicted nucleic acid-binding protein